MATTHYARKKPKCIICGRVTRTRKIKYEYGSLHICDRRSCVRSLSYRCTNATPIVWFDLDDLKEKNLLTQTVYEHHMKNAEDTTIAKGDELADYLWRAGQFFGDEFYEGCQRVASNMEIEYIDSLEDLELPLVMIESLKSEEAKTRLEDRLKRRV